VGKLCFGYLQDGFLYKYLFRILEVRVKKRWLIVLFSVLVIMSLSLLGCPGGPAARGIQDGGTFDVVVIGTGIGGTVTAMSILYENPALSVLVIDKMNIAGGSTRFAGVNFTGLQINTDLPPGNWPPVVRNSSGRAGFEAHWRANAILDVTNPPWSTPALPVMSRVFTAFEGARGAIAWLNDSMNVPFNDYQVQVWGYNLDGSVDTAAATHRTPESNPRFLRRTAYGGPAAFVANTIAELERRGAEVRMETRLVALIVDGGAVRGIQAVSNGMTQNIMADTVILATGGFSHNHELMSQFTNAYDGSLGLNYYYVQPNVCYSNTGDGIVIAMRDVNADVFRHPNGQPSVWAVLTGIRLPAAISGVTVAATATQPAGVGLPRLVGGTSNVVWNGAGARPVIAEGAVTAGTAANVPNFGLQDQIIVNHLGERFLNEDSPYGSAVPWNNIINAIAGQAGSWIIFSEATTTPAMRRTLDAMAAVANQNYAVSAATPAALATAMGIPATLAGTIAAYNAAGPDAFGKASHRAVPLTGNLWAVRIVPGVLGTMGGLNTNADGRVINTSGAPVPNLFAVGEISNRPFFGQGYVGGSCLSLFVSIGRHVGIYIADLY